MSSTEPVRPQSDVIEKLVDIVGIDHCLTSDADRRFYSTDLSYIPDAIAEVVVQPANAAELATCVACATAAGMAVVPRGGGMSYTRGYQPERGDSMLVDMRRMNRILEINTEDMYVTVEAGCTWKELYEALGDKGVRTPYFGPLSGMYATIGGAVSQNSLFLGSGIYNTVAESVLGLKVALADGSLLQTGSAAQVNGQPFWRHFGPDLTGIFTADTGAFGIKAEVTLRLIEAPEVTLFMSFGFDTIEALIDTQQCSRASGCVPSVMASIPTTTQASKIRASRLAKGLQCCAMLRPPKGVLKACGHLSRSQPPVKLFCAR